MRCPRISRTPSSRFSTRSDPQGRAAEPARPLLPSLRHWFQPGPVPYSSGGGRMHRRRLAIRALVLAIGLAVLSPVALSGGPASITPEDLRDWLTYIASDQLQGRALYGAGLGMAATYISDHLKAWGVTPAGDTGSYLQSVRVLGIKRTSRSTITVQVGNDSRTFMDGETVIFPNNAGAKRRLTVDRVEFAGYGLDVPAAQHIDLGDRDLRGAAVVWLGVEGPRSVDSQKYR